MSNNSLFSIQKLGLKRAPEVLEYEAILNLVPQAALVVDAQSHRILSANTRATELSGFTRQELVDLNIEACCPEWDRHLVADGETAGKQNVNLIRRNGTQLAVQIAATLLPPKAKHGLITLERRQPNDGQIHLWNHLYMLANAPHQFNLNDALDMSLQTGQGLTRAKLLAIYQVNEEKPGLQRLASFGDNQLLPAELPFQDLIHLRSAQLWKPGKRSISALHRLARGCGLAYVASAPIGQPNAVIGLLVIADPQLTPSDFILQDIKILAATITTVLQQQVLISNFKQELSDRNCSLAIHSKFEASIQEGLIILYPDLRIMRLNPAAENALGYSSKEIIGQPVERILIGTETLLPALTAAQQGSASNNLENVRLYRRSGEAFLAKVRTLPVFQENSLIGIIVLLQDLSEQELIQARAQQLEQRAMLGEVTAVFAHEVRNPINNISTGLQLMAINLPEHDPNQEMLQRLQTDCDRLAELMKSVLQFSKPAEYEMERLDIGLLLQRLLERLHPRMERVNVQCHLQVDPQAPLVLGNSKALEQVFNNLINNAVQAMSDKGGRLALKVQPHKAPENQVTDDSGQEVLPNRKSYLEISVADTGPGIPKEMQDRVFQPFFTTKSNGTGLGLAISKRIITAHKGTLSLTSFPGGTVFHVQLPISEA